MDPIRKMPKKVTKKFVSKVINRQYFHRKTGLNVHVRVSSWTWHLTGNQTLVEEVFSRQKRSGEKMANPRVPLFLQFPIKLYLIYVSTH